MSRGKKWLWRLFLLGFVVLVTMGLWLPPIITHAVEKDYHFSEVEIDATVLPTGDMVLEETRTFDFQNGPFTYAYFNVDDPLDHVARLHDRRGRSRWWTSGSRAPRVRTR